MKYVLFELDLTRSEGGQIIRLTTAPIDLIKDGETFRATGDLLQIDKLMSGADLQSSGLLISLSGIDPSYQLEIEGNGFLHAPVALMYGEVEEGSNIVTDATYFHRGFADTPTTVVDYSNSTITIGLETQSLMGELDRIPNLMACSVSNHAARHNGDRFFEYTADSGTTEIWKS